MSEQTPQEARNVLRAEIIEAMEGDDSYDADFIAEVRDLLGPDEPNVPLLAAASTAAPAAEPRSEGDRDRLDAIYEAVDSLWGAIHGTDRPAMSIPPQQALRELVRSAVDRLTASRGGHDAWCDGSGSAAGGACCRAAIIEPVIDERLGDLEGVGFFTRDIAHKVRSRLAAADSAPPASEGLREQLTGHEPLIEGSADIDGDARLVCSCGWDSDDAAEDEPFMAHVAASSPEPVPVVVPGVPGREPATRLVGQGGPTGSGGVGLTAGIIHEATDNAGLPCDGDHSRGWGLCQLIAARLPEAALASPAQVDPAPELPTDD